MAYNNHPQNPYGGGGMSEDSHQYGEYAVRRERERDTYTSEGSIQEYGGLLRSALLRPSLPPSRAAAARLAWLVEGSARERAQGKEQREAGMGAAQGGTAMHKEWCTDADAVLFLLYSRCNRCPHPPLAPHCARAHTPSLRPRARTCAKPPHITMR